MNNRFDITFHPGWWYKNAGISFDRRFFDDCVYRVEADMCMRRVLFDKFGLGEENPVSRPILGSDLIAAGYIFSEMLGCQINYSENSSPKVIREEIGFADLDTLSKVTLETSPQWERVEEQIVFLLKEYGAVIPCINLMGIQNIALDLRGQQIFMDYYDEPSFVHELFSIITHLMISAGKRLKILSKNVSAGVTAIVGKTVQDVFLTSNCSVDMVSLKTYSEFLLPYDNMLAESFSPFGIHHCGGHMERIAPGYALVKNLKFAEVGAGSDLTSVARMLQKDVMINARYSPVKLAKVSKDELEKDLESYAEAVGDTKRLSVSCVGIDANVSDKQVSLFLDTCQTVLNNA